MRRTCPITVGDVKRAIEQWRRDFVEAAIGDGGRHLLNRWPDYSVGECADEEVELFVTNLSFCLLDHSVPLWAPDGDPVSTDAWSRLRTLLDGNRYGCDRRRYVLELHGPRDRPLCLGTNSISARPPHVRIGDLYASMPFDRLVVRDRQRSWTRHSASRSARALLDELSRDHVLTVQVSFRGNEFTLQVQQDHEMLAGGERIAGSADSVASALGRQGFLCGEPHLIACNAASIPIARRRRMPDVLFLIPRPQWDHGDDLVLLPTPRVMQDYSVVVVSELQRKVVNAAERAGVQLLSFGELLLDDNRERLRKAARMLPA